MEVNFLKKDNLVAGIVIGIITPLLIIYIQFLMKKSEESTISDFIYLLKSSKQFLSGVSTIALIANGLLFGILIQFKKYETAKGVFIPTVLFSLGILLYKLF